MNLESIEWELHPFFVGDVLLSRNIWKSQYGSTVFENVTDKALFMVNTYSHLGEVDFRFGLRKHEYVELFKQCLSQMKKNGISNAKGNRKAKREF